MLVMLVMMVMVMVLARAGGWILFQIKTVHIHSIRNTTVYISGFWMTSKKGRFIMPRSFVSEEDKEGKTIKFCPVYRACDCIVCRKTIYNVFAA